MSRLWCTQGHLLASLLISTSITAWLLLPWHTPLNKQPADLQGDTYQYLSDILFQSSPLKPSWLRGWLCSFTLALPTDTKHFLLPILSVQRDQSGPQKTKKLTKKQDYLRRFRSQMPVRHFFTSWFFNNFKHSLCQKIVPKRRISTKHSWINEA